MLDQPPGGLMTLTHYAHKPSVSVILGDFNARSTSWWSDDIDSLESTKLLSLSALNGFHQIISEPTRSQRNSSSCIDLIFTDQLSLVTNNGVHSSLHSSCQHQINAYFGTTKGLMLQTYKML